jgi:hypothetical protein
LAKWRTVHAQCKTPQGLAEDRFNGDEIQVETPEILSVERLEFQSSTWETQGEHFIHSYKKLEIPLADYAIG